MKYFLYKLKTLKIHIVAMCIFAAASYPLFCIAVSDRARIYAQYCQMKDAGLPYDSPEIQHINTLLDDANSTAVFVGFIGAVALIAMFTMAIPILMRCFGYLHKKPAADMEMTAPVTVRTRFFGNFFAGLAVYLVPHIIGVLVGTAVLGADTGIRLIDSPFGILRRMMIYGLMMCVLFYCSTMLIVAVCGRMRTAVILTVFMNFAIPAITICSGLISFRYGYGLKAGLIDEMLDKTGWFTPLGLLIKFFAQGLFVTEVGGNINIIQMIQFLLYCALFVIAAYFLVKRRRHERTGKTYTFRYARHFTAAVAVLAATLAVSTAVMFSVEDMTWSGVNASTVTGIIIVDAVMWLIASFGLFCAFEFADSKGEKNRKKRFIMFAPFILGSALVTFAVTLTQGFGAAYYVPDVKDVVSAKIYTGIGDMGMSLYGFDAVDTAAVTELHSEIISANIRPFGISSGSDYVDISYGLKDGRSITRYYTLPVEYSRKAFEAIKKSSKLFDDEAAYSDRTVTCTIDPMDDKKPFPTAVEIPAVEIPTDKLQEAFSADVLDMTYEQAKAVNYDDGVYLLIDYEIDENRGGTEYKRIYPFFTHTLALLEVYGIPSGEIFGEADN
jgi:hypothetical protein